jgi:WD40 repeat protein
LLEIGSPGSCFALASLGGSAEPRLVAPSIVRCLPGGFILALSDSEGAAYAVAEGSAGLAFTAALTDPGLAGAKDIALTPEARAAYVASGGADEVALLSLGADGTPLSVSLAAAKDSGALASFSKPGCCSLSPDGSILALGTTGDDAIYLFDRNLSTNALSLKQRIDKSAFPAQAPLSDPCSLAFSPDGLSLFVLSYYGKALIRLDRDAGTGLFAPKASAKSGLAGVSGFATPKRLALSPDGKLIAVVGSGSSDGLALFRLDGPARLDYLGSLASGSSSGKALPDHPVALAFSTDGKTLAVAADGSLSLFSVGIL